MDDMVLRGMARWPDVPCVFGWLSLDRRGRWRLRGETIGNRTTCEYIARNYQPDACGRWYFQNGPQRVFVTLEVAPLVFSLLPDDRLRAHTGVVTDCVRRVLLDARGDLLLDTPPGAGVLQPGDLTLLGERFCAADGTPLADEQVEAVLAAPADTAPVLFVRLRDRPLAVERIDTDAQALLGFVREPQARPGDNDGRCA